MYEQERGRIAFARFCLYRTTKKVEVTVMLKKLNRGMAYRFIVLIAVVGVIALGGCRAGGAADAAAFPSETSDVVKRAVPPIPGYLY